MSLIHLEIQYVLPGRTIFLLRRSVNKSYMFPSNIICAITIYMCIEYIVHAITNNNCQFKRTHAM